MDYRHRKSESSPSRYTRYNDNRAGSNENDELNKSRRFEGGDDNRRVSRYHSHYDRRLYDGWASYNRSNVSSRGSSGGFDYSRLSFPNGGPATAASSNRRAPAHTQTFKNRGPPPREETYPEFRNDPTYRRLVDLKAKVSRSSKADEYYRASYAAKDADLFQYYDNDAVEVFKQAPLVFSRDHLRNSRQEAAATALTTKPSVGPTGGTTTTVAAASAALEAVDTTNKLPTIEEGTATDEVEVPSESGSSSSGERRRPQPRPFTFMDVGCAPGAFSRYIIRECVQAGVDYRGYGVTLDPAAGGYEIHFDRLAEVDSAYEAKYTVIYRNLMLPEAPDNLIPNTTTATTTDDDDDDNNNNNEQRPTKKRRIFDLILLGATTVRMVNDSQWSNSNVDKINLRRGMVLNELIIALENLAPGGTLLYLNCHKEGVFDVQVIHIIRSLFARVRFVRPHSSFGAHGFVFVHATGFMMSNHDHNNDAHQDQAKEQEVQAMIDDLVRFRSDFLNRRRSDENMLPKAQVQETIDRLVVDYQPFWLSQIATFETLI